MSGGLRSRLEFLAQASARLARCAEAGDLPAALVRLAAEGLGTVALAVVRDEERGDLVAIAHRDPAEDAALQARLAAGAPLPAALGEALAAGAARRAVADEPLLAGCSSVVAAPLLAGERTLGALAVACSSFDEDEVALVEDLARRAALALDNARLIAAERTMRQRAERLEAVAAALSAAADLGEAGRAAVEQIAVALGARGGALSIVDEDGANLELVAWWGVRIQALDAFRHIPLHAALPVTDAVRTARPILIGALSTMLARYPAVEGHLDPTFRAWVAAPLVVGERAVGAAWFVFDEPRRFTDEDERLLLAIGRQAGLAIRRAQLFESEHHARARAERVADLTYRLQKITDVISRALSPEDIAAAAIDVGTSALAADAGAFFVLDAEGRHLVMLRESGFGDVAPLFARMPVDSPSPMADAIRRGEDVWLEDVAEYAARYPVSGARVRELDVVAEFATACLPLVVSGRTHGGLTFAFHRARRFDDDERRFIRLLARHCAQALDRARLFADVQAAAEQHAQTSRTLEAVISACPAGVMLLDMDGTVRLWNDAAERVLGWTATEALGHPLPAVPPERHAEFRANLEQLARGERLVGAETRRLSKHRGMVDVALWAAPVVRPDGTVQALSLVADISDRKEAERERERRLADQRADRDYLARLQRVTAALAEAATVHDVAEVVVREGCAALDAEHGLLAVPDAPGTLRLLAWRGAYAGIAGQDDTLSLDAGFAICAAFRDGERVLIQDEAEFAARFPAAAPTLDPLGTKAAACVPVRSGEDVRAAIGFRFAAAHTFDDRDRQLLSDLASLTALALGRADLYESERAARHLAEEALTTAREAEQRKDEFLAMLGHELRNPLAPILLALQVIQLHGEDPFQREHVIIERQVRHLERLVDDLLDVSRITRGKVELKRERVELSDVVAKAVELTSPLLEQKSHRLDLDVPRGGLLVEGDYVRLTQVVANLLTNAAKYTPDRGRISVSARGANREIALAVRDSGVGIAPDLLPHVFDMFVQAPQTLARSQGGLGLGLTIVSRIVALHGGRVAASSEGVGRGSEFVVRLPAADPASAADLHATLPGLTPIPVRAPRRILVVEDNPDAAALVAGALAALGHEVSTAYDGLTALEIARTFRPQVVCLDLGLPLLDGYETARRLRADVLPGVPLRLVAITGYGQEHDRARARAAGIDRHLVKPVDLDVLVAAIDGE